MIKNLPDCLPIQPGQAGHFMADPLSGIVDLISKTWRVDFAAQHRHPIVLPLGRGIVFNHCQGQMRTTGLVGPPPLLAGLLVGAIKSGRILVCGQSRLLGVGQHRSIAIGRKGDVGRPDLINPLVLVHMTRHRATDRVGGIKAKAAQRHDEDHQEG